jgi:hypothetical protein
MLDARYRMLVLYIGVLVLQLWGVGRAAKTGRTDVAYTTCYLRRDRAHWCLHAKFQQNAAKLPHL